MIHKLPPIGLQTYTIREQLSNSFKATLESIKDIGFQEIELMGYENGAIFNNTIEDSKQILDELNINVVALDVFSGIHNRGSGGTLRNNFEQAIEDALSLGAQYITCIYLFPEERQTMDDYFNICDLINKCAEKCAKAGIGFLYHHHEFEFEELNNKIPFEILLDNCDSNLVQFEIDFYWMAIANQNPVLWIEKQGPRFPIWHIKDLHIDKNRFEIVGKGKLDWNAIFSLAKPSGMKHFFVEQDLCYDIPPLQAIAESYTYLQEHVLSKQRL